MKKTLLVISICILTASCSDGPETEKKNKESLNPSETSILNTDIDPSKTTRLKSIADSNTFIHPDHLKPFFGDLDEMKERRVIRALVTYSKTDFFIVNGQIKGLQAELLQAYEKELNKNITKQAEKIQIAYIPVKFDQLLPTLNAGLGDISAALLTVTPERDQLVDFTDSDKASISEVLVRHHKAAKINSIKQLAGKTVYVLKSSSYAEHLREINIKQKVSPPIIIAEADERLLTEDVLEIVNAGIYDYTVADDYKVNQWAQVLPNLRISEEVNISIRNRVGWAIRKNSPLLQEDLNKFTLKVKSGSLLGNILIKRYLGSHHWISNPLLHSEKDKLIKLMPIFTRHAKTYKLDPLALAAQAYQESKLDQNRVSHKGAIGIMQIMPTTAKDKNVAIEDISKVENNIHAGAKYMAFIKNRYFSDPSISEIDQILLSLAAYNAGPGNVRKMRKLTLEMGLDQNQWFGHVEIAAGKIIGRETVQYVSNIYKYYQAYKSARELYSERQQLLEQIAK